MNLISKTTNRLNLKNKGNITPALLIIASSFIIVIYAILFVLTLQFDFSQRQVAADKTLQIAEAGINYYRWHLQEDPDDFADGTGTEGQIYEHTYSDPQGGDVGTFSLEIDPPTESSQTITIISTAWTDQFPGIKRKIVTEYGKITLTKYAFLHNSNMWFSDDITVTGPVFSNGGIRQDGTNTSTVESAKETYICGVETGCQDQASCKSECTWDAGSSTCTCPGIWGNGEIDELWNYPVTNIDFDSIKVDFSSMKTAAMANPTGYLGPSTGQGYHLIFSDTGDVNVYEVTGTSTVKGYSIEYGCEDMQQNIVSETLVGTYSLSSTPIIFVEDNVWVEGTVNGKTTVAAARFPLGTFNAVIWIPNNLVYLAKDGNHKLGLVAENDIVFTKNVPEYFYLNGALLAQNGRTIRHHYGYFGCKSGEPDKNKKEFNFYGSLISNLRSYWNHSSGPKSPASGFTKTTLDYDQTNFGDPPPFFPSFGGYEFLSWQEESVN